MEGIVRVRVPHKAPSTREAAPRSLPITWGRRISRPSLKILADDSSPGTVAAQPSVSQTSAMAKQRARRLDDSLAKLDEYGEAVNPKKQHRYGTLPLERSAFPMVDNWNCSESLTVGSEIRDNNAKPNKQSRSSVAELQGHSSPMQNLEAGKCRDTIKDSKGSGPIDNNRKRLLSERERSKRKILRKCNDRTIRSASTAVNGEIKLVVLEKVNGEPIKEYHNARASRENINKDAPKASHGPVSKIRSLRDPRSGTGMAASPADRFYRVFGTSVSQERHSLHEKSHVAVAANNREPSTPSFLQTIQWVGVGHRQHRSRARRMNITFSVPASSYVHQVEGCDPSKHGRRVSAKANRRQCTKDGARGIPHMKVKLNGLAPARLPEYGASPSKVIRSAEMSSGGVESNKRCKRMVQLSNSISVASEDTTFQSGEILDGKQREESISKMSRFAKSDDSSLRERLDKGDPRLVGAVNKNESDTGSGCPPVGKSSDQKNSTHQENSLLYDGICDDWNELFEVPNLASKPSCLTSFEDLWKDMELVQTRDKDRSSPKQQGALIDGQSPELQTHVHEDREPILISQSATPKLAAPGCQAHQEEDISTNKLCTKLDTGAIKFGLLFERVVSAFIFEDGRTLEGNGEEILSFLHVGESTLIQSLHESCHGDELNLHDDNSRKNIQTGISIDELPKGAPPPVQNEQGFMSEELLTAGSACSDECYRRQPIEIRLLLELQSLGIYPEALPDLVDEEDGGMIRNIFEDVKHVAEQLDSNKARSEVLSGTVYKRTSVNDKDLEGSKMVEVADPGYIEQPLQRKRTASWISKPEVPEHAAPASTLLTTPVRSSLDAACSQGKQPVVQAIILSSTDGTLSDDRNVETNREQLTIQVSAASEAATIDVNKKGETGSANPRRNEESVGPSNDLLDGKDLSLWLDTGDDDATEDSDLVGLHIPMDDLFEAVFLL